MAKQAEVRLSQRKYADYLGVSNTLVGNAIRDGFIKKGFDKATKQILVSKADAEWGALVRKKQATVPIENFSSHDKGIVPATRLKIDANADLSEAVRVEKIAMAQLRLLDLAKEQGSLISKDLVQKALFGYGQEIRKSFEHLPERNIDKIRAAGTRNEALQLFSDAVEEILMRLTDVVTDIKFEQK